MLVNTVTSIVPRGHMAQLFPIEWVLTNYLKSSKYQEMHLKIIRIYH